MFKWFARWRQRGGSPPAPPPDPAADGPAAERSARDQIRELAKDLITLEINTILKENMVAGPMPTIPNALVEIADSYIRAFQTLQLDVSDVYRVTADAEPALWEAARVVHRPNEPRLRLFQMPDDEISFSHLFIFLRWAARKGREAAEFSERDRITLRRIEDNSDKIRCVLQADKLRAQLTADQVHFADRKVRLCDIRTRTDLFIPPPNLSVHERLLIRKIWEVGSEWVVAQTVIQIDGDVVTRIARDFSQHPDIDKLLGLHHQGLETGLARWDSLVNAAVAVVRGLTGLRV